METTAPRRERSAAMLYLFIAYGWTWLLWVPPLLAAQPKNWLMPSPNNYARLVTDGFASSQHMLLALLFSLAVYGPLLGSLAATRLEQGAPGVRALLRSTTNWQIAPRWYGIALLLAAALSYLPVLLAALAGGLAQPEMPFARRLLWFVPLLLLQMLTSGLGEEPGWRGYLLPWLQKRFAPGRAVWLLGLAWAVWHYPLTILFTLQGLPQGIPAPAAVITILIALLGQTLGLIGLTYLYVWLYNRIPSVFLMIFFHALTNILGFLAAPVLGAWSLLVGVFPWIVVLVLQRITGKPLV